MRGGAAKFTLNCFLSPQELPVTKIFATLSSNKDDEYGGKCFWKEVALGDCERY